jgi:O-antigen ligase
VLSGKLVSKGFCGVCLLILSAGLFQLSSRSALIAMLIILTSVIPFLVLQNKHRWRFAISSSIAFLVFLVFITVNSAFHNRYITDLKEDLTETVISNNLLEPRAVRWECAVELIKTAPILGYGSGSEVFLLKEVYFRHHFYGAYINELNAHNEYLSIWIKTGILGLALYILILIKGFSAAIRTRNAFFLSYMILITIVGFAENILDVNKGIFFYACFFALFYISEPRLNRKVFTL